MSASVAKDDAGVGQKGLQQDLHHKGTKDTKFREVGLPGEIHAFAHGSGVQRLLLRPILRFAVLHRVTAQQYGELGM